MRRALPLVPLVLLGVPFGVVGCKPGRQASVSSVGGVASTVEGGTFVAGQGRVAEGGDDVAWSPDGSTLAISTRSGVVFWPKGDPVPKMHGPLAWSPFGDRLAGKLGEVVVVHDLASGATKPTTLGASPEGLCWTPDGRLIGIGPRQIEVDGGLRMEFKEAECADAVATADGKVTYLARNGTSRKASDRLTESLSLGQWDPTTGTTSGGAAGKTNEIFGTPSPRRLDVPLRLALAPDGRRYAAACLRIEAGTRALVRLKALADRPTATPAETKEINALLKGARLTSVVVLVSADGHGQTLWSALADDKDGGPTDLAWSPDGAWLAIARRDGTVRLAAE